VSNPDHSPAPDPATPAHGCPALDLPAAPDLPTRQDDDVQRSGSSDEVVLTRSEEQLRVGTETVVTGRARLRKVVVTEQPTITVTLRHEEYVLDREAVHDGVPVDPTQDPFPPLGSPNGTHVDAGTEIVLHAERPVITTEIVPVERIRLAVRTVSTEQPVTGPLRHEVVEYYAPNTTP
jgi:stress response protein YsnF